MTGALLGHWTYPLKVGETLSSNEWVEFHIHRFLTSRFKAYCLKDGEAGRAIIGTALILWAECYRQDPAGTLPDDDVELAQIAGYGADVAGWQAVRKRVLHGWRPTHCEDEAEGVLRLGHLVIADIAQRSYHRKAGKAAGREASQLSVAKSRVKKHLAALRGGKSIAADANAVEALARWLETSGLWITEANVTQAATVVLGYTPVRVITGGKDD
jgi:hypothetical protein